MDAVPTANHDIGKDNFIQTLVFARGLTDFAFVKSRKFNKYYVVCKKRKFLIQELLACIAVVLFISFMVVAPPYSLAISYKILIAIAANIVWISGFMTVVFMMLKKMPFLPILTVDCAASCLKIYRRRNIDLVQIKDDRFAMAFSKIDSIKIWKTTRFLQPDGITNWGASGFIKFIYLDSGHNSDLIFITTYGPSANRIIKSIGEKIKIPIAAETRNYMERYAIDRDTGIMNEQALTRYSGNRLTRKRLFILFGIALVIFILLSFLLLSIVPAI